MAQRNLIGKTILGYTVNEMLGSGAFGTVYKVIKKDVSGEYVRALKHITIPNERQYDSILNSMGGDVSKADSYFLGMLKDIVSEIRILNDLSEKGVQNIVRYYEHSIEESGSPKRYDIYILMEYLTPLADFIKGEEFTVRDVVNLGTDILYALHLCHANGVMHRDVKDDNLFISVKGEYKIGDFGVSKVLKDSSKAESMKGTPNFLAPEVYLGKESYTKSVDLYSLGIVLYRLLNYNRNPFLPKYPNMFHTADEDRAFEKRMRGDTPALPLLGGEFIGTVIVKAISKSSERYQTAKEFIDALEDALNHTSAEILNESIKISIVPTLETGEKQERKMYQSTIGEIAPNTYMNQTIHDNYSSSINRNLFYTVGEKTVTDDFDEGYSETRKAEQFQESKNGVIQKIAYTEPILNNENTQNERHIINGLPMESKQVELEKFEIKGEDATIKSSVFQSIAGWIKKRKSNTLMTAEELYQMGEKYYNGDGVEKDVVRAVKCYQKAAEQGHVSAQMKLGLCYDSGDGIECNEEEAEKWLMKAAKQNDSKAQVQCGLHYYLKDSEQERKKCLKWYMKAANNGNITAQYFLGKFYYNGEIVEQDYREAVRWFKEIANQGNKDGQFMLANCYFDGHGIEPDCNEAMKWYQKAAEQGYVKAQLKLGYFFSKGIGVEKDEKEAVFWYKQAAEQGDTGAQYICGLAYDLGKGVERNEKEAVKWYMKAAEDENTDVCYRLGYCYYWGRGIEQNYTQAMKWLQKASSKNCVEAQFVLGDIYYSGKGVERNYDEAIKWFRKAAEQGYEVAEYALGNCYYDGEGVGKDYKEAIKWYEKAAEQGLPEAQNALGDCYYYGKGAERDYKVAVEWYRKAAEQGDADAQNNLGCCYNYGNGVLKDYRVAKMWYRKAAEQGHSRAKQNLQNFY